MAQFVDPRDSTAAIEAPDPNRFEKDPLGQLRRFCREGRLYEVEQWIRAGRALQEDEDAFPPRRNEPSALRIALETNQHSLCRLLLSNGFDTSRETVNPLDTALSERRWDLVDLLWDAGADPKAATVEDVFATYNIDLYERFWEAGADFTANHALASFLSEHPANKPLLGFVKRHLADAPALRGELNIALGHCIEEKKEKGIHLCLWAGADPHARAIDISDWRPGDDEPDDDGEVPGETALIRAADKDRIDLLKRFKPDPAVDDFTDLYRVVRSIDAVEYLSAIKPPEDLTEIATWQLMRLDNSLTWPNKPTTSPAVLAAIFLMSETRWEGVERNRLEGLRRQLLKIEDALLKNLITILRDPEVCDPAMFAELTRTPSMRKRMRQFGLLPPEGVSAKGDFKPRR